MQISRIQNNMLCYIVIKVMLNMTQKFPKKAILQKRILIAALHLALFSVFTSAHEQTDPAKTLDAVEVTGIRQRLSESGRLADYVEKTEVITANQIERHQSGSLAKAIETAPGIRVQNECSMCGIKRVMINGMKGEQTTILVDGVPMHSVVSSYYGIDAVTSSGIGALEIARGPGAALATPEAIGGAINIISERGLSNSVRFDLSGGNDGYAKGSFVGTGISQDGSAEGVVSLQYDNIDQFDGDDNGVNESPSLRNKSFTARGSFDLGDSDNIEARFASYRSAVFGGPMNASREEVFSGAASGVVTPFPLFFVGGDVRNRYIALPYETAEVIDTKRHEGMLRYTHLLNEESDNISLTASLANHGQDSIYEGFDYRNDDDVLWLDGKYTFGIGDSHLISAGVNLHREKLRSESDALALVQAEDPTVYGDSFDYRMAGLYLQDVWNLSEATQLSLAARFDKITVDYIEQPGGKEIDETLFSPRALLKLSHSDQLTSRFSVGRGYRAPLSFFESDHGLIENGYEIEVTDLEKSISLGYSLNYAQALFAITGSLNTTQVDNLAFIDFDSGERPILRNFEDSVRVSTADFDASYQLSEHVSIGGGGEVFRYSDGYKGTFGIPPIEERLRLFVDFSGHEWSAFSQLTWVGSRNLAEYDTADRFNVQAPDGTLSAPKVSVAPSYFSIDARMERKLGEHWAIYVGGNNLSDYNQAADEESPLFFDGDGAYDVVHLYGPLRGRVLYAGIKANF